MHLTEHANLISDKRKKRRKLIKAAVVTGGIMVAIAAFIFFAEPFKSYGPTHVNTDSADVETNSAQAQPPEETATPSESSKDSTTETSPSPNSAAPSKPTNPTTNPTAQSGSGWTAADQAAYDKAQADAAANQAKLQAEQEAQRIAGLKTQYKSEWDNALAQNDAAWSRAQSNCQNVGVGYSNQRAVCMVNNYGGSVSDYYPTWTNNAYNAKVNAINSQYQSLCNSVGGC